MGYAVTVLCKSLQIANVSCLTEDTDFDADSIQFLWEKTFRCYVYDYSSVSHSNPALCS